MIASAVQPKGIRPFAPGWRGDQCYSTDGGATWQQAGSGFTLSATAQNIMRTGSFAGVTDIALVTEDKNWSSNTHTLAGLNAFSAAVDASVGDAYIIGPTAIGIFAGHEGKVAICEADDAFTIYTPADGNIVHDVSLGIKIEWSASSVAWRSAAGAWVGISHVRTPGAGDMDSSLGFTTMYQYGIGTFPTTSQARIRDNRVATAAAKRAGALLRITYSADVLTWTTSGQVGSQISADNNQVLALFRASESTAIAKKAIGRPISAGVHTDPIHVLVEFLVDAPDAASHTYFVAFMGGGIDGSPNDFIRYPSSVANRDLMVEESI